MSSEQVGPRDISEPQFLHYSSVLFDLVSHGRELLMPVIFGFLGAASGSWFWGGIALFAFSIAVLRTLIRYFTLRYSVSQGELLLNEGWIFRTQRTVPLGRIQNVDLRQNVVHRLFGVAEVRVETASGSEAEAVLRVLTRRQIEELRQAIFGGRSAAALRGSRNWAAPPLAATETPEGSASADRGHGEERQIAPSMVGHAATASEEPPTRLLSIPLTWLILAGLAGNRGWVMISLALGGFFQFDLHERLLPQQWKPWLARLRFNWDDLIDNWFVVLLFVLVVILLLKILGVAWFVYRFFGYRLERVGEDLRVSAGLLSSYSTSVPRRRIQFVSIHRPLVLSWFDYISLRIETAGGAGGDEESSENLSRTWFVPILPNRELPRILEELRPGLGFDEQKLDWQSTSAKTKQRLVRIGIALGLLVTLAAGWWIGPWGLLIGLVAVPHQIWYAIRRSRSLRYARTTFGVVFRSGIFYRKLSFTFFDRIQTVQWKQTLFDRRWGMATLVVDTAASGPADHQIVVPYLKAELAQQEFFKLQESASMHQPHWR